MNFSAANLAAMLQPPMGQLVNIDDGSLAGLEVYGKFTAPQVIENEFTGSVEMSEPALKVATADVEDIIERGVRLRTGGKDYTVKRYDARVSGFTVLWLEDL